MAFFKDFMNKREEWRRAKDSSWAILSDHDDKEIFYGLGFEFVWHTAIRLNLLHWHFPPARPSLPSFVTPRREHPSSTGYEAPNSAGREKECSSTCSLQGLSAQAAQGSYQGDKGMHMWLRTLNKAPGSERGITGSQTLLGASYKTAMYARMPQIHGRRLHVVTEV